MKNILLIVLVLVYRSGFGQENLNNYKYIIIPKKFENFKIPNQYQTSTLLKYAFTEKGFLAIYDDVLPEDLFKNRCLGLIAQLKDESSLFGTKVSVGLKDCAGQEVFSSMESKNRIKSYNEAYKSAILASMTSFDDIDYSYTPLIEDSQPITVSFKNDVKTLKGDIAEPTEVPAIPIQTPEMQPKNNSVGVTQTATETVQTYRDVSPVDSMVKKAPKEIPSSENKDADILYAQPIANGYQLVDGTPKVVMKLMKSSTENVYIANGQGRSGMVFQSEDTWVFEYYLDDQLVRDELRIKF